MPRLPCQGTPLRPVHLLPLVLLTILTAERATFHCSDPRTGQLPCQHDASIRQKRLRLPLEHIPLWPTELTYRRHLMRLAVVTHYNWLLEQHSLELSHSRTRPVTVLTGLLSAPLLPIVPCLLREHSLPRATLV
jgi:hypothetical protein